MQKQTSDVLDRDANEVQEVLRITFSEVRVVQIQKL